MERFEADAITKINTLLHRKSMKFSKKFPSKSNVKWWHLREDVARGEVGRSPRTLEGQFAAVDKHNTGGTSACDVGGSALAMLIAQE